MSSIVLNYLTTEYRKHCRLCLANVNTMGEYRKHLDEKHPDRCEYCGDKMWSDEHRRKHMLKRHSSKKRGM